MYYLAEDLNYITKDKAINQRKEIQVLMNAIGKFMKYLRDKKTN